MALFDKGFWTQLYQNNTTGWDIGYAAPAIIDYFGGKNLRSSILIPGCGNSYEGEVLHKKGFKSITLLDHAEQARGNFLHRVPSFDPNQFVVDDFFRLSGAFDFIIEQTFFCAIDPSLREQYAQKTQSLLKPQGKLVGLLFDAPLNTDHPPFGGNSREYEMLFKKYFQSINIETCLNSIPSRAGRELFIEIGK